MFQYLQHQHEWGRAMAPAAKAAAIAHARENLPPTGHVTLLNTFTGQRTCTRGPAPSDLHLIWHYLPKRLEEHELICLTLRCEVQGMHFHTHCIFLFNFSCQRYIESDSKGTSAGTSRIGFCAALGGLKSLFIACGFYINILLIVLTGSVVVH